MAQHDLDRAVAAVIITEPVKEQLLSEFFAVGRHLLRLAQIARTLGINVMAGVSHDELGLSLRLVDQIQPGSQGASAFKPDGAFSSAISDLRDDPDVALPDLPLREPR
jgi:hypothetical protein